MAGDTHLTASSAMVGHIPVAWVEPEGERGGSALALWMPAPGIDKEGVVPFLCELAAAGFVAVSFDPWDHGERGSESAEELRTRVFAQLRRRLWPIFGHTALEALRVIDWSVETFGVRPAVVAGGVSMGGNAAVALAGIDRRVAAVAAIGSTPDWLCPGMRDFSDPPQPMEQGEADAYAQWFYDQLDPLTHLDRYARAPSIAFECGAEDQHVPADGALRFEAVLRSAHPAAGEGVRVSVHPGIDHLDAVRSPELHERCLGWLRQALGVER